MGRMSTFIKKRASVVMIIAALSVFLMPLSVFALTSDSFTAQKAEWSQKHCVKNNTNQMFSAICFLLARDDEQQEQIDQLAGRIDAIEGGEVSPSTNLQLQIAGVKLGEAVSVNNPIKYFSKSTDRLVQITELGDTASGSDLSYHFGLPRTLYYISTDCSGTAYVAFNGDGEEEERLLNNVISNGVNQHYIADRSTAASSIEVGSLRRFDQVAKVTTCHQDDLELTARVFATSRVTLPLTEPLPKPFLFVYE